MRSGHPFERLLVCYVPGLDLRRVAAGWCRHIADLLDAYPSVRLRAQGTHANLASLITGTHPHEHRTWGPRLRPDWQRRSLAERLVDSLPDVTTTTVQGGLHMLRGPMDLATMPPRRRRRFDWQRFNMKYVRDHHAAVHEVNGVASIFNVLGRDRTRFVFVEHYGRLDRLVEQSANGDYALEMIGNHGLDYLQHWNLDQPELVRACYAEIDDFVGALHAKCTAAGIGFVLLSDHGQEPVRRVLDPLAAVRRLGLPEGAYDRFVEYTKVTFWFHSDAARAAIAAALEDADDCVYVPREAMIEHGVLVDDRLFGDAFLYAEAGVSFFPNDFYQPLANAVLALKIGGRSGRLRQPWHRGDHGYLPNNESEIGFLLVAGDGWRTATNQAEISLTDVAPSLLTLLGAPAPATMTGPPAFRAASG